MAMTAAAIVILLAFAWKFFCSFLRYRRSALIASLHPSMHSHALTLHTLYVEFPFLSVKSLDFALFRTYAIPQISRILQRSGHFEKHASKRYDDTDILVHEFMLHHVDGDRGSLALRRLNFLHSNFPINNAEYLYTLSLFILLPIEWAALYGYREWTELEKCAYFTNWHDIGTRMGIRNIPESLTALSSFKEEYEAKNMVYSDSNKVIADLTMRLFLTRMPSIAWPYARRVAYALMDERLRTAVGYPAQPWWLCRVSHGLLKLHGVVTSWMPPRPLSWAVLRVSPGCPRSQVNFDPETVYKLAFQSYLPAAYEEGFKVKEVGAMRPGELGKAYEGDLICSLEDCSNLKWQEVVMGRRTNKKSATCNGRNPLDK